MTWALYEIKKYISELRFLSHGGPGFRIIGYTNEDNIDNYSNEKVNNEDKYCLITDNNYWLTVNQINELKSYNEEPGYIIPVYEYIENIGLQSDWTLDDINPDYISQDNESEENKGTENGETDTDSYALHSIEYIFDHCMDETATTKTLFGPSREPFNRF